MTNGNGESARLPELSLEAAEREQILRALQASGGKRIEAARLLGVSIETIRRWDAAGQIKSIRTLGGQRRFRREEIDRVLAEGAA